MSSLCVHLLEKKALDEHLVDVEERVQEVYALLIFELSGLSGQAVREGVKLNSELEVGWQTIECAHEPESRFSRRGHVRSNQKR